MFIHKLYFNLIKLHLIAPFFLSVSHSSCQSQLETNLLTY